MAKRFGEADSPAFVNGVLDAVQSRAARGAGGARRDEPRQAGSDRRRSAAPAGAGRGLAGGVGAAAGEGRARCARWASIPIPTATSARHGLAEIVAALRRARRLEELEALAVPVRIAGPRDDQARPRQGLVRDAVRRRRAGCRSTCARTTWASAATGCFDLVDLGDFIGVAGRVMRTRKGELSVQARELTFLSKALLPPPEKWHGLADVETRYRQRYVDLMANPEVRRTFVAPQRDGRRDPPLPGRAAATSRSRRR